MALYGWFLKHTRTGKFVRVTDADIIVVEPSEATRFSGMGDALAAREGLQLRHAMMRGIELEVVDATIPDEPTPDADATPVPTRDAVLKAARERGADRRTAHGKARAEAKAQPTGRIIPHPGFAKPKRKKAVRK